MRKLSVLAGLLLLQACRPAIQQGKPPKHPLHLRIRLPSRITDKTFTLHRQRYWTVPPRAQARAPYRLLLLRYIHAKFTHAIEDGRSREISARFAQAAKLYDPAAVHDGAVKPDRLFLEMAARLRAFFSPSGDEQQVVPALAVEMEVQSSAGTQLLDVLSWTDRVAELTIGPSALYSRSVQALEEAAGVWPSRKIIALLEAYYRKRVDVLARQGPVAALLRHRRSQEAELLLHAGYRIARHYLAVDRPEAALDAFKRLSPREPGSGAALRRLLENVISPAANIEDFIRLAEYVEDRDKAVALRICRHAVPRFFNEPRVQACIGRLAAEINNVHLAIRAYEQAFRLAPASPRYAEALAIQYQRRLFNSIGREQLDDSFRYLKQLEHYYAVTERRLGKALKPTLARVYFGMAHGLYNAGRVKTAQEMLARSLKHEPLPEAVVQLATIEKKAGNPQDAVKILDKAETLGMHSATERIYWQARIDTLRGHALMAAANEQSGREALRRAVSAWDLWLRMGLRRQAKAEALLRRAKALYALGDQAAAMDGLDAAIDADPTRKETYADVIAWLTNHGHLPEALDAYHRALGREEVGEYLKTYCTFWVIGLARRANVSPDPLALNHLRNLRGGSWYVKLAQMVLGKASFADLEQATKTDSRRAELYFYRADQLLADGKIEPARSLWKKVIDTKMMAFFEYDMAARNLLLGPPKVRARPVDRTAARPSPSSEDDVQEQ